MNKQYLTFITSVILTLTLTGAGCNQTATTNSPKQIQNDVKVESQNDQASVKIQIKPEQGQKQPEPVVYESQTREFTIIAKNWEFSPNTIIVNQGDKVIIKISSVDTTHSFMIKDYNINVKLEPNKTQTIEFIADKFGVFPFHCGVPCGEGHKEMTGTLVVK